jgi:uncharacterized linocin/CFP29 family protein
MNGAIASGGSREMLGMPGSSGKWAGEQWLRQAQAGQPLTPGALRANGVLRRDEWIFFDEELVTGAQQRLRGVADLLGAGLVKRIPNGMAKTVYEYELVGDMEAATVSLDGITRSEMGRVEFAQGFLPLPITHKDFYLNLRALQASRSRGEPMDTTHINAAGRKVGELTEEMLFRGGKSFGGYAIYGYTTHPSRHILSFGAGGNWAQAAKTGAQMVADVASMITALQSDQMFGPYWLYVGSDAQSKLSDDFKDASDKTVRARLLELEGLEKITVVDKLTAGNLVLVQATKNVIQMVEGEPLQTVQWDVDGGFRIDFKAFQIMVPLIRSDSLGNNGVAHMS